MEPWTLDRVQVLGGRLGLPPHQISDYTIREIDNFARGHDLSRRAEMATMLWAFREGAQFNAFAFAGKRIPKIEQRLRKLMEPPGKRRASPIAEVVERMNAIAIKAGMPPPKRRAKPGS